MKVAGSYSPARKIGTGIALLVVTLMGIMLAGVPASPASAHSSDYCGHGTSGTLLITEFEDHFTMGGSGNHIHVYSHWNKIGFIRKSMHENQRKVCNFAH